MEGVDVIVEEVGTVEGRDEKHVSNHSFRLWFII